MSCKQQGNVAGTQAKTLTDQQIESLLAFASLTRNPERNRVVVLLSLKAGLHASEITKLTCDMAVGPTGEVGRVVELHNHAAKNKRGRRNSAPPRSSDRACRLAP
jgi:hypothetical protein